MSKGKIADVYVGGTKKRKKKSTKFTLKEIKKNARAVKLIAAS